jgi:hypothetical protein
VVAAAGRRGRRGDLRRAPHLVRAPFARLSLREAAAEAATERCRLGETVTADDLRDRARAAAGGPPPRPATVDAGHGAGKLATEIFERLCEDQLVQPTFVYDFPTEVSPLSKQKADDPDTVERFELYVGGFEVANAFSELNDPEEQRRRFEQQLEEKRRGDAEAHAMDEDYIRALEYGLPPTGGRGHRRRSARDAAHRQPVDPRRDLECFRTPRARRGRVGFGSRGAMSSGVVGPARRHLSRDCRAAQAAEALLWPGGDASAWRASQFHRCICFLCLPQRPSCRDRSGSKGAFSLVEPFELHVAWRYLLAKRKQAFISLISLISTLGVAVGVSALVIAWRS